MNAKPFYCLALPLCFLLAACQESKEQEATISPDQQAPSITHRETNVHKKALTNIPYSVEAIEPDAVLLVENDILDLVVSGDNLLISSIGFIEIYNLQTLESKQRLEFEKIENFYGDLNFPHLFSADLSPSNDKVAWVLETATGKSVVQLQQSSGRTTLIEEDSNLAIRKVRFLGENKLLMATIESEAIMYDLAESKIIYKHQLSRSSFSDFSINAVTKQVVFANESGAIPYFDGETGKMKAIIEGGNLDNIYDIDFKRNKIITGGKDRSVSIYDLKTDEVSKFLAEYYFYAVTLDAEAQRALFVINENYQVGLFDIDRQKITAIFNGSGKNIDALRFINNHQALGATYNKILFWSFK